MPALHRLETLCGVEPHQIKTLCGVDNNTKRRQKKRKRVTFHPSTKTHDGVAVPQANLERLISDFFQTKPKIGILMKLLQERKKDELSALLIHLRSAVYRVLRNPNGRSPLLIKGGGKGIIITKHHLKHMEKAFKATTVIYKECVKNIASEKEKAAVFPKISRRPHI
jgi:hypothetical protein